MLPYQLMKKVSSAICFHLFHKDRDTYQMSYLNNLYNTTRSNVKLFLKSIESINIYVDEWTQFNLNFVGIFCSTIEKDALLACGVPNKLSRSSNALGEYITAQLSSYNIKNKTKFCSTDFAPKIA